MKKFIMLITGMLFIMVSCQKEKLVKEDLPVNTVTEKIVFYPCSGTMGIIVNPDTIGHFNPPPQMLIEGCGTATIIGEYTVKNLVCVDEAGNFLTTIKGYITDTNGNEIHTQVDSYYPDPENPDDLIFDYIITGGTGRFEKSTGWVKMSGIIDFEKGTWNLSGEGEITY